MDRTAATVRRRDGIQFAGIALMGLALVVLTGGADSVERAPGEVIESANPAPVVAADLGPTSSIEWIQGQANLSGQRLLAWYRSTPPMDRITWGGLIACGFLGLLTAIERTWRVRKSRVIPKAFRERFHTRLIEGELDWGKGLDYCELNPSPAARVALAAIKRWGRPAPDLDRAVALARQAETDRLRRHVGTLRRVAALAPLLGLLGTLQQAGQALASLTVGEAWGPPLAASLVPLTTGVGLAILALVAYDGLMGRVETIAGELDRIGAELVDVIALAAVAPAPPVSPSPRVDRPLVSDTSGPHRVEPSGPTRSPHPIRVDVSDRFTSRRPADFDDDF